MTAVSALLFIPGLVLFVECMAALLPGGLFARQAAIVRPTVTVLVPAHNEAPGIRPTLEALLAQLAPQDQLIVIADNCNDDTANVAREVGATVIERHDTERRGKGYALDFGVRFLDSQPPDVVVIVDADCLVSPGTIEAIAQLAATHNRPVQATYLLSQPAQPTPKDAVSMLAFTVKNLVRPTGLARLGLPCPLTGTGMAFPWEVIKKATLASGNIVEDMNLGVDLALAGHPPLFCPAARVTGILPQQTKAAKSQRTRWEHGHLQTILTQVPRLLNVGVQKGRFDLLAIALDLLVPPLSLLVMVWIVMLAIALLGIVLGTSVVPSILLGITGVLIFTAILSAWAKFSRADLPLKMLLAVPFYILWKIPLYFTFLFKPQTQWVRTERDAVNPPSKS